MPSKKKMIPNVTKNIHKRNPFQNHNYSEYDDEVKEEELAEDVDVGVTIHKSLGTIDTKNHSEIFYKQMNAIAHNIIISSSGLNLVKAFFKYIE